MSTCKKYILYDQKLTTNHTKQNRISIKQKTTNVFMKQIVIKKSINAKQGAKHRTNTIKVQLYIKIAICTQAKDVKTNSKQNINEPWKIPNWLGKYMQPPTYASTFTTTFVGHKSIHFSSQIKNQNLTLNFTRKIHFFREMCAGYNPKQTNNNKKKEKEKNQPFKL